MEARAPAGSSFLRATSSAHRRGNAAGDRRMNVIEARHYARTFEATARDFETALRVGLEVGEPTWKLEAYAEGMHDAKAAAAEMRSKLATARS